MAVPPPVVQIGSHGFAAQGTPVLFATLPPGDGFDSIDAYVDPAPGGGGAKGVSRIIWQLFAIITGGGGVPTIRVLIAQSLPMPSEFGPYLPFDRIDMIEGTSYELVGIATDAPVPLSVNAGIIGYNRQADVAGALLPDFEGDTLPLAVGSPQTFGAPISVFHNRFQAQVDANGSKNCDSDWILVGNLVQGPLTIGVTLMSGKFSSAALTPVIVLSSLPKEPGLPSDIRGASNYQLIGTATNPNYDGLPVKASLVGYDVKLGF